MTALMMHAKSSIFLLIMLAAAWSLFPAEPEFHGIEPVNPISREEFVARVKASYGFLSAREPKLERGEYAILEKFVPYLEFDTGFALSMIEGLTKNNKNLTASFDFLLGNLYVQSDRLEDAERAYKEAIRKHPDFLRAWKALGLLYMNYEDIDNALKALTRSIQLGDTDPVTFGQIGYCFLINKDYIASLSAYSQAILYDPGNVAWMLGKIAALKALNDFAQANIILREIVRRQPGNASYWMELANNWICLGEPIKAAACLEFLREAGLETRASMEMLGTIYVNESMETLALNVYEFMIGQGDLPNGSSLLRCAEYLQKQGMASEAESLVSIFMKAAPKLGLNEKVAILRYQSLSYERSGDYGQAKEVIEKALEIKPDDGESLIAKGRIEYQLGYGEQALITLAQAEHFTGCASEAAVMQAQILVAWKDYSKAEKKLQAALLNGGDAWVKQCYEEVRLQARKAELDRLADAQFLHGY